MSLPSAAFSAARSALCPSSQGVQQQGHFVPAHVAWQARAVNILNTAHSSTTSIRLRTRPHTNRGSSGGVMCCPRLGPVCQVVLVAVVLAVEGGEADVEGGEAAGDKGQIDRMKSEMEVSQRKGDKT